VSHVRVGRVDDGIVERRTDFGGRRGMRVRVMLPSAASGAVCAVESALSSCLFEVEITLR
jgi:hypothetical protein